MGSAALDAVYPDARNPYAFPELLGDRRAWSRGRCARCGSPGPAADRANHYVDITDTFSRKIAALSAHESQTGQREGLEDFLRAWLASLAEQGGLPAGRLAEVFQVLDTA